MALCGVHVLMSLTVLFSLVQIVIAGALLWFFKWREEKDLVNLVKRFLFLICIPVAIGLFYYGSSPKFLFWFERSPLDLILANLPIERLLMILLVLVFAFVRPAIVFPDASVNQVKAYFVLASGFLLAAISLLIVLKIREVSPDRGFALSNRYFIFLTPVGIVATGLTTFYAVEFFKRRVWAPGNLWFFLTGVLIIRFLETYKTIVTIGLY